MSTQQLENKKYDGWKMSELLRQRQAIAEAYRNTTDDRKRDILAKDDVDVIGAMERARYDMDLCDC